MHMSISIKIQIVKLPESFSGTPRKNN